MVYQLVKRVPSFAPTWKELAVLSDDEAETLSAIDRGLAAKPDSETKGILQINKAVILQRKGDHEGAVRLLGALALDAASTYATEHMAKVTLSYLLKTYYNIVITQNFTMSGIPK